MIVFDEITKEYKTGHVGLDKVSFTIESGEFVFLMGPSGSGKTTLLRLMLRELEPTSGKILIANQELGSIPGYKIPMLRRQIGAAFQDFKLIPDLSAFENVAIALEILGHKHHEVIKIASQLLERVGLSDKMHLYPSQLSGGEVQRVAIARAVATDPVLLFADEPTGNLDPVTAVEIVNLLEEINTSGTTVLMATHDLDVIAKYPHRRIVLSKGKIAEDIPAKPKKIKKKSDKKDEE